MGGDPPPPGREGASIAMPAVMTSAIVPGAQRDDDVGVGVDHAFQSARVVEFWRGGIATGRLQPGAVSLVGLVSSPDTASSGVVKTWGHSRPPLRRTW